MMTQTRHTEHRADAPDCFKQQFGASACLCVEDDFECLLGIFASVKIASQMKMDVLICVEKRKMKCDVS